MYQNYLFRCCYGQGLSCRSYKIMIKSIAAYREYCTPALVNQHHIPLWFIHLSLFIHFRNQSIENSFTGAWRQDLFCRWFQFMIKLPLCCVHYSIWYAFPTQSTTTAEHRHHFQCLKSRGTSSASAARTY